MNEDQKKQVPLRLSPKLYAAIANLFVKMEQKDVPEKKAKKEPEQKTVTQLFQKTAKQL